VLVLATGTVSAGHSAARCSNPAPCPVPQAATLLAAALASWVAAGPGDLAQRAAALEAVVRAALPQQLCSYLGCAARVPAHAAARQQRCPLQLQAWARCCG
jgi:hypothetical protein